MAQPLKTTFELRESMLCRAARLERATRAAARAFETPPEMPRADDFYFDPQLLTWRSVATGSSATSPTSTRCSASASRPVSPTCTTDARASRRARRHSWDAVEAPPAPFETDSAPPPSSSSAALCATLDAKLSVIEKRVEHLSEQRSKSRPVTPPRAGSFTTPPLGSAGGRVRCGYLVTVTSMVAPSPSSAALTPRTSRGSSLSSSRLPTLTHTTPTSSRAASRAPSPTGGASRPTPPAASLRTTPSTSRLPSLPMSPVESPDASTHASRASSPLERRPSTSVAVEKFRRRLREARSQMAS